MTNPAQSLHRAVAEHLEALDATMSPLRFPVNSNNYAEAQAKFVSSTQELRMVFRRYTDQVDARNQLLQLAVVLLSEAKPMMPGTRSESVDATVTQWHTACAKFIEAVNGLKGGG